MKIDRIDVRGFKRFTDLSVQNIPNSARLVMLVGPNGSGKSSLIDAVYNWFSRTYAGHGGQWDSTYHEKQELGEPPGRENSVNIKFHGEQPSSNADRKKAIYVRSAYRNDPEFEITSLSKTGAAVDEHRIARLIDNDQVVSRNYQRLVANGFEGMFDKSNATISLADYTEGLIADIRSSMRRLFPDLLLNSLGDPLNGGTFKFDKGSSSGFLYKNLSGGEKAAFDLLLDLVIKRREFDDTVFFIDEPEAHMGTRLQSDLLAEMWRLVPDISQLWIATHSLGMMRKARELADYSDGSVVFLDFDGRDFDVPQVLEPAFPSRPFWKRALQIALDDFSELVAPKNVFLCEGGRFNGGKSEFDADCYNLIFQQQYPDTLFIGAGNCHDVARDRRALITLVRALAPGVKVRRVIDRDDRTDADIATERSKDVKVLALRSIESYLLSDEVLELLETQLAGEKSSGIFVKTKVHELKQSRAKSGRNDDLKAVASAIYQALRRSHPTGKIGSNTDGFLKSICAPLITPNTSTYRDLHACIFETSTPET